MKRDDTFSSFSTIEPLEQRRMFSGTGRHAPPPTVALSRSDVLTVNAENQIINVTFADIAHRHEPLLLAVTVNGVATRFPAASVHQILFELEGSAGKDHIQFTSQFIHHRVFDVRHIGTCESADFSFLDESIGSGDTGTDDNGDSGGSPSASTAAASGNGNGNGDNSSTTTAPATEPTTNPSDGGSESDGGDSGDSGDSGDDSSGDDSGGDDGGDC